MVGDRFDETATAAWVTSVITLCAFAGFWWLVKDNQPLFPQYFWSTAEQRRMMMWAPITAITSFIALTCKDMTKSIVLSGSAVGTYVLAYTTIALHVAVVHTCVWIAVGVAVEAFWVARSKSWDPSKLPYVFRALSGVPIVNTVGFPLVGLFWLCIQ